eukprot:29012_1
MAGLIVESKTGVAELHDTVEENQCAAVTLSDCKSCHRIKHILQQYHNSISSNPHTLSENAIMDQIHTLINHESFDGSYSTLQLVNDFDHVKYSHSVHDNPVQFDSFYAYLIDSTLHRIGNCNINECQSVHRHYHRNRSETTTTRQQPIHRNTPTVNAYTLQLLSRIHTYFIHSHETTRLSVQDIKTIEETASKQHNNDVTADDIRLQAMFEIMQRKKNLLSPIIGASNAAQNKYITSYDESLDYPQISNILNNYDLPIRANAYELETAFDQYHYTKQQFIQDVFDAFYNKTDDDITLARIWMTHFDVISWDERHKLYDILLHKYVCVESKQLNHKQFMQILAHDVPQLMPNMDTEAILETAQNNALSGRIFMKGQSQFRNSVQFAKLFESLQGWNRKLFCRIYMNIKQWKMQEYPTKELAVQSSESEQDDTKTNSNVEYLLGNGENDDESVLNLFAAITNCEKNDAALFLKESEWNIQFALNKYYQFEGDISRLDSQKQLKMSSKKIRKDKDALSSKYGMIYNHGIHFWYWKNNQYMPKHAVFVTPVYRDLKEEVVSGDKLKPYEWNNLHNECNTLLRSNVMKNRTSNGNDVHIYGIPSNVPFTLKHLLALKLYTDFTSICGMFCNAFRVKKLTENTYESVKSLKRRNQKFANMAKCLIESVQCYGHLLLKNRKYYRGINKPFIFQKFVTRYRVPLSTTWDFNVAVRFADAGGLVVELGKYGRGYDVSCFNCGCVSSYDHEREMLFFGGDSVLSIASIYQFYKKKFWNYKHHIAAIEGILAIANGSMTNNTLSLIAKNLMVEMIQYRLRQTSNPPPSLSLYIETLLNYHIERIPNRIECDWNELMYEYNWLKTIFVKNSRLQVLNISNLCNLFAACSHVSIVFPNLFIINDAICTSLLQDLTTIKHGISLEFVWATSAVMTDNVSVLKRIGNLLQIMNITVSVNTASVILTVPPSIVSERKSPTAPKKMEKKKQPHLPQSKASMSTMASTSAPSSNTMRNRDKYEELLVVGLSRMNGVEYDIPSSVSELCHMYFGAFIFPSLNSKVRIKQTNPVLRSFELFNRDDYQLWMKKYNETIGIVVDHHITNGVQVKFNDNKNGSIWYEPACFSQLNGSCIQMKSRYLVDDKVTLQHTDSIKYKSYLDKVGIVCKYESQQTKQKDDKQLLNLCFGDHNVISDIPSEYVKFSSSFFGDEKRKIKRSRNIVEKIISFEGFCLREKIKIKDDFSEVQSGFEICNRSDCYEWMKRYCSDIGYILRFHATNGICLQMEDSQTIWFESPCIEKVDDDYNFIWTNDSEDFYAKYHQQHRLLVGTKVRLTLDGHKYNGRVGRIGLHFPKDRTVIDAYHRVTVKFSNDAVEVFPETLQVVTQYYNV